MRAPAFWNRSPEAPGLLARLLWPLSLLWRLGGWLRALRTAPFRAPVPVICVGNLTAGGAGKTPTVAALIPMLEAAGLAPHVLSRGHGGSLRGPHRVNPARDSAAEVGDEPLTLAPFAPVWIARDRTAGARAAAEAGAGAILMDDGFQNPALAKDLSILVIDAATGFGNARVIPAGPLREPLADGLARADLAVLVGPEPARRRTLARWPALERLPLVGAEIRVAATGLDLTGLPVVAFAGIGRPEKFFATVEALGARLVEAVPFADHYAYPRAVVQRLIRSARGRGAMLVTTEKDAVRLPEDLRAEVMAVPVRLSFEDPAPLDAAVARLAQRPPG